MSRGSGAKGFLLPVDSKNGDFLQFVNASFIDNREAVKPVCMGAVESPDDLFVVQQYHHFTINYAAPLNDVQIPVFHIDTPVKCLNDRGTAWRNSQQAYGRPVCRLVGQAISRVSF